MSLFQILPTEPKFYDWFEKGARNLVDAATLLCSMFEQNDDWPGRAAQLTELEHQGDFITHEIFDLLNKTFITPLDPPEIEALASRIDDAVDFVQAAGDALLLYQIAEPLPPAGALAGTILAAAREVAQAMALLREKKRLPDIMPHVLEINRLENEADRIVRDAISALVTQRGDPFEFIRWKEIYDHLEDATDRCEDIADVLRTVVIKYA
jgi:uncharacterized protein Yka (UPF0111/DUF47 family)